MAWLAVDKDGTECVFKHKPQYCDGYWVCWKYLWVKLPQGSIEKLIGRKLTWENRPVEI